MLSVTGTDNHTQEGKYSSLYNIIVNFKMEKMLEILIVILVAMSVSQGMHIQIYIINNYMYIYYIFIYLLLLLSIMHKYTCGQKKMADTKSIIIIHSLVNDRGASQQVPRMSIQLNHLIITLGNVSNRRVGHQCAS